MDLRFPIISDAMFPEHAKPVKKVKIQQTKKFKAKTPKTIRDNTRNILDEKYRMYIEQSAMAENEVVPGDNHLLLLLILVKFERQSIPKIYREKAIKRARQNKRFAQDYQIAENAQSDMDDLVANLEKEDLQKQYAKEREMFELYLWANLRAQKQKYYTDERHALELKQLQERAKKYFLKNKTARAKMINFANQINAEKTVTKPLPEIDLQDLYELYHYDMGEIVKYVNSRNK